MADTIDYEIKSARQKKVERQKKQNEAWQKSAEEREKDLCDKANGYYTAKLYRKAAHYYREALSVRYPQWDFRVVGKGSYKTVEPARHKERHRLETSRTRHARTRLDSMDEKISAEKEKGDKKDLRKLFDKAEVAMMLGDKAKAYEAYGAVIALAEEMGQNKLAVRNMLKAIEKRKEIVADISKPLAEAEKLIKEGKAADARKILEDFEREYASIIETIPELKGRHVELSETPEIREENREQEVQRKILAGDAALLRKDYLSAEKHYRAAATMDTGADAREAAAKKLADMLNDPAIVAAMKVQRIARECKPLVARARYLVRIGRGAEARLICRDIINAYRETEWAEAAQEILDAARN